MSPLFLLVLRSENKQRQNMSDGDGFLFTMKLTTTATDNWAAMIFFYQYSDKCK